MARTLKTFGWRTFGRPSATCPRGQRRAIVAATTAKEAAQIAGFKRVPGMDSSADWSETGNDEEIAVASAEPGVVFWQSINAYDLPKGGLRWERRPESVRER